MILKKGDIIDIISPATPITKTEMNKIGEFLAKKDLKARFFMEDELLIDEKAANFFPKSLPKTRFEQLKMALASDSKAIWCAKGGYGSADLVEFFDEEVERVEEVGYSWPRRVFLFCFRKFSVFLTFLRATMRAPHCGDRTEVGYSWPRRVFSFCFRKFSVFLTFLRATMRAPHCGDPLSRIKQNKIFIGFSDITALSIFLQQRMGQSSIYGANLAQLASQKLTKKCEEEIFDVIFGRKNYLDFKISVLNENYKMAKFRQKLVGGCLSLVMQSFATINEINFSGKILFLEDEDEKGEKLDRYFQQLLQIMARKNSYPKAILLGRFFEKITGEQKKSDILQAIQNLVATIERKNLDILVLHEDSLRLGHGDDMSLVKIGGEAEVDLVEGNLRVGF